jgi:hypothetical protein
MSILHYLQEAGAMPNVVGRQVVDFRLMPDGVLIHARNTKREVTYLVSWKTLELSKVNPLLVGREMVLRRLSGAPTNGGGHHG